MYGSVADYYQELSSGTFRVEGKVFPWVTAAKDRSAYTQSTGGRSRTVLLTEAIDKVLERDGKDALKVNWLELTIRDANDKITFRNSWITDLPVDRGNVEDFARSILTTDTRPKIATRTVLLDGQEVRVLGIAKGAAMIGPNLATMLAFVCTDAAVTPQDLQAIAEFRGESLEEVRALYTRWSDRGRTLREKANGDCVFFERGVGCTVYAVRPRQCRTWPFWDSNVATPERWQHTCEICPGSGQGELIPPEEIIKRLQVIRL